VCRARTEPNGDSISLKSGPGVETSTIDFIAFGIDVDTTPPPADEVGDLFSNPDQSTPR
jgi:hypothetical protein